MALNAEKFFELMNTLPDDMLVSAVRSEPKRNRKPMYIVSAIAACLVIGVTAVVYPKLKVQPPEIREPAVTSETTLTTTTTTSKTLSVVITETSEPVLTTTALSTVSTAGTKTTPIIVTSLTSETSLFIQTERDTTISSASTETTFVPESHTTAPPFHPETIASVSTTNIFISTHSVTEPPAVSDHMITTASTSTQTITYTIAKSIVPLPEPPSGSSTDPSSGQPMPFVAKREFDGNVWNVVLAEPCKDASIVSGRMMNDILYLSIVCLIDQNDFSEETIGFSFSFPDDIRYNIADIIVERQDYSNHAEYIAHSADIPVMIIGS